MNDQGSLVFVVRSDEEGQRLDLFLCEKVEGLSRSQANRHVAEGAVIVEGRIAKPSLLLRDGDRIIYKVPPVKDAIPVPEQLPLNIVHEDEYLAVIDKRPGMVVHPAPGHSSGTLVNAVLYHCRGLSGIGGVKRPGIVHRLDKDTSGLLVVAKTDGSHLSLSNQFKEHSVERRYLAIVAGNIEADSGRFITGHKRHPRNRKKFTTRNTVAEQVAREEGTLVERLAETHYRVIQRINGACLVEALLRTGRTHQVRVHFSEKGHSLLGDSVYGNPPRGRNVRDVAKQLGRQALHAAILGFKHPATGDKMLWISEMPEDMKRVFESLGGSWPLSGWPPDLRGEWQIMVPGKK